MNTELKKMPTKHLLDLQREVKEAIEWRQSRGEIESLEQRLNGAINDRNTMMSELVNTQTRRDYLKAELESMKGVLDRCIERKDEALKRANSCQEKLDGLRRLRGRAKERAQKLFAETRVYVVHFDDILVLNRLEKKLLNL